MIKFSLFTTACLLSVQLFSQDKPVIKYYDSAWSQTPKESAFYYAEFLKQGDLYKCSAYWAGSKKLNGTAFFPDTSISKPRNLMLNYYENGKMQDSAWYDENSQAKFAYHYYQSGKLLARYFYDKKTAKAFSEGFDEEGKLIKDFVYAKEAEFPGGSDAWIRFLSKNLNTKVPVKNGAPNGTYQVIILFMINKKGDVTIIKPETNMGYGMEEEAIRVIRNSPRWHPLILLGDFKNAYRRQPVTFLVTDK